MSKTKERLKKAQISIKGKKYKEAVDDLDIIVMIERKIRS